MALALAQAGAQVAILARHAESTKTVAENIQAVRVDRPLSIIHRWVD
jgi:NAD(P)-dependent dehydrogenase (short-subunit alcohol dehydrogenase family)